MSEQELTQLSSFYEVKKYLYFIGEVKNVESCKAIYCLISNEFKVISGYQLFNVIFYYWFNF